MKFILIVLGTFAFLHFRCGAEVVMMEEEISIQRVIRKYIPTYQGSNVMGLKSGEPSGNATSCGPDRAKIVLTWTPKTIVMGDPVSFNLQMIAPSDLDHGTGKLTIYISGESTPFAGFSFEGGCDSLKQQGVVGLKCPIKMNDQMKLNYDVPATGTLRLMEGHFLVEVKIKNDKQEVFACVRIDTYVKAKKPNNSRNIPYIL
ncbi:uncharacterized protein LOC117337651 isoform X2 [Pecten maximus]|nr:uncharacterized protein LOC117337651 isoform X2 [Pecten maximus]